MPLATDNSNVHSLRTVTLLRTGKPGRPRKEIDSTRLQAATAPDRMRRSRMARSLGISAKTLRRRLNDRGLDVTYSDISDEKLDQLVRAYCHSHPTSGRSYIISHLHTSHGVRVQRQHVINSIHRTDGVGRVLRTKKRELISRRTYRVKRPHALWHIDGHHKLILWGIVTHSIVDGYSRKVTGIHASGNNRASTVLEPFIDAVQMNVLPSQIRADRGKENKDVALYMLRERGLNCGSFIWGSSTHNTRIERLWVEVGHLHGLQRDNPHHLWIIHHLFLDLINQDCSEFQREWNGKPISGLGHNQSPDDILLTGMIEHGVYLDLDPPDDCDGLTLDQINESYGVRGSIQQRRDGMTGARQTAKEPIDIIRDQSIEDVDVDSDQQIADLGTVHDGKFTAPPVKMPRIVNPFNNLPQLERVFVETLAKVEAQGTIPEGYGMQPGEWEYGSYPSFYQFHLANGVHKNFKWSFQI
ncbi:hypothetical protein D9758_018507 [Tetrapyrgos nigripes]|uniref:Integrase catalytic domain-containing protein n=1 Tax=Tetrapyrgos nigripes TaxID=182062 RepID=A0A8H5FEF3_9AGAR|nr:hypothetical protein D9758_018507 [Tetrapyrgos nigripes]